MNGIESTFQMEKQKEKNRNREKWLELAQGHRISKSRLLSQIPDSKETVIFVTVITCI